MPASSVLLRPRSDVVDLEPFRIEVDTRGFRSQLTAVGARALARCLVFEARYVSRIVWIRSEHPLCACGNPLMVGEHACSACAPFNVPETRPVGVDAA